MCISFLFVFASICGICCLNVQLILIYQRFRHLCVCLFYLTSLPTSITTSFMCRSGWIYPSSGHQPHPTRPAGLRVAGLVWWPLQPRTGMLISLLTGNTEHFALWVWVYAFQWTSRALFCEKWLALCVWWAGLIDFIHVANSSSQQRHIPRRCPFFIYSMKTVHKLTGSSAILKSNHVCFCGQVCNGI